MFGPCAVSWQWLTSVGTYACKRALAESALCFRDQVRNGAPGKDFTSIIDISCRTTSTDPRDKVYALLSLIDPRIRALIQPDYDKSVPRVFAEATYASIAGTGRFNLLLFVHGSGHRLPSWAYNFATCQTFPWTLPEDQVPFTPQNFPDIVGSCPLHTTANVSYDDEHGALIIKGRRLGCVAAQALILPTKEWAPENNKSTYRIPRALSKPLHLPLHTHSSSPARKAPTTSTASSTPSSAPSTAAAIPRSLFATFSTTGVRTLLGTPLYGASTQATSKTAYPGSIVSRSSSKNTAFWVLDQRRAGSSSYPTGVLRR